MSDMIFSYESTFSGGAAANNNQVVGPAQLVPNTASPMTITATKPCAISVVGVLTGCTYVRGPWSRTVTLGNAMYEMSIGDQLVVTYLVAPVIYLLPR